MSALSGTIEAMDAEGSGKIPVQPTIEAIREAASALEPVVRRTPVLPCRTLSERVGIPTYLKCENLQRTGSFKPRGAYTRISRIPEERRHQGVVAASAGNHAQGVAWAATELGIAATVFMPEKASLPKVAATRAYGAEVVLEGDNLAEALDAAKAFAARTGATVVHPYDHEDVVLGQATVGLEICEQVPDVGTILVPLGGGGLLAGIAAAVRELKPHVRIVGVQAAQAAAWPGSLSAGHPVRIPMAPGATMADGIAVPEPGGVPFGTIASLVDDVVTVDEEELSRGLLLCLERAKILAEPAGAAAVAAMLAHPPERLLHTADSAETGSLVAVVSGGNIDPLVLHHVTLHGLRAAGRFATLRVTISDAPGGLAGLVAVLTEAGASIVEITHLRVTDRLHLGEVQVEATVETGGPSHRDAVQRAVEAAGYAVELR